jgi:hypothetical protein
MRIGVLLAVLLFCGSVQGQKSLSDNDSNDSILLNNGRIVVAHVTDTSGFSIEIIKPHSHKHKKSEIPRDRIFSIRFGSTGHLSVLYIYDTLVGNDYTVEEAHRFIEGEQDAQRGYRAIGTSAGAFAVGVASGIISGSFEALAPPFVYGGIMSYKYVKVRHKSVKNLANGKSDAYLTGYSIVARRKRTIRAFLWGGIGVVAGTVIHYVILAN